jgi:hypothetical protein
LAQHVVASKLPLPLKDLRDKDMGILDSKDGKPRISRLVILNAVALSLLTWLIVRRGVPLYFTTLTAPVLFIVDFVVIWRAYRRDRLPGRTTRLSKLMWFPALVFTASGVVVIVYWVRNPDVRSTVQAIGAIALAGWTWFLVVDHRRTKRVD